jgi:hypothetical protein
MSHIVVGDELSVASYFVATRDGAVVIVGRRHAPRLHPRRSCLAFLAGGKTKVSTYAAPVMVSPSAPASSASCATSGVPLSRAWVCDRHTGCRHQSRSRGDGAHIHRLRVERRAADAELVTAPVW